MTSLKIQVRKIITGIPLEFQKKFYWSTGFETNQYLRACDTLP